MSTATDFVRQLADQLQAEQDGPRDVTAYADLVGVWHWVGASAWTLPSESEGFGVGEVIGYGSEFEISSERVRNSFDRHGHSLLVEILRDEAAQLATFGEIVCRRGPWPTGVLRTRPGSVAHAEAAQAAREAAFKIADPDRRAHRLREIRDAYGTDYFGADARSRTLAHDRGGSHRDELMLRRPE